MAINNIPNLFQSTVPGTASMPITYDSTPSLFNIDQAQIQQAINQKKIDEEQQQRKRLDQQRKLQNLADTFRMINANKSGNVGAGNVIADRIAQRKALFEENKNMQEAFGNNPELLSIYNTFGKGAAFQESQRLRNAEINAAQQKRQIEGLKEAGFSNREINLFVNAGMKADDILALRDQNVGQKSLEQLDNEIENEYVSSEGLEKITQGFSAKDAIDNVVNQAIGPIFGTVAEDTDKAISAKKVLNENLRERFVNQYSGRPSVYLNQRIDALLPQGVYLAEEDAFNKYTEIKRVLEQAKLELIDTIKGGMYKDDDLIALQNEYKSTSKLLKDLDTVTGNLKGSSDVSLDVVDENNEQLSQDNPNKFGKFFGVNTGN